MTGRSIRREVLGVEVEQEVEEVFRVHSPPLHMLGLRESLPEAAETQGDVAR